jgi:UDP-glucose 4-epimerase
MFPAIGRVYDNRRAREALRWKPRYDFCHVLGCLAEGRDFRSSLARAIGAKGYHDEVFAEGPYPV